MKRPLALVLGTALLAGVGVWQQPSSAGPKPDAGPAPATAPATGVRSITLPTVPVDLPPGPGRDTVATACAFCHSNRYVTGQPRFPREKWAATVDKMRKTYGAPMSDQQAAEAVDYLVSVRGPAGPTTKP